MALSIRREQSTQTHKIHQHVCKHTSKHATDRHTQPETDTRTPLCSVLPPLLPQWCGNCPSFPTLEDPHTSRGLMGSRKAYIMCLPCTHLDNGHRHISYQLNIATAKLQALLKHRDHARTVRLGTPRGNGEGVGRVGRSRAERCEPKGWRRGALGVRGRRLECAAYLSASCRDFKPMPTTTPAPKRTVIESPRNSNLLAHKEGEVLTCQGFF